MRYKRGRASIADLLILALIVLVFTTLLGITRQRTREVAYMMKCASNLRVISTAITQYVNTHREWPRTRYEPDAPVTAYTAPLATRPFAADGPAVNDVTAAIHLLIREGVEPHIFQCPISPLNSIASAQAVEATRSNFVDEQSLNYSFANPYPSTAAVTAKYKLDHQLTAEMAIAADMNRGAPGLLTTGIYASQRVVEPLLPFNHRKRTAFNVLYGDGHVEGVDNPFVGTQRDNVFTFGPTTKYSGGLGIVGSPTAKDDSVLLPVADLQLWQPILNREAQAARWVSITLAGASAFVLAAIFLLCRLLRSRIVRPQRLA